MNRWTSQFKMMDRLLALKKPISEYFRQQPQNPRKLTPHKWTVTNEVCSLLGDVSEATIRMQGAKDTHISQAMFIVHEVMKMLRENIHPTRVQNATVMPLPPDGPHGRYAGDGPYPSGAGGAKRVAGGDGREESGDGEAKYGASVRVVGPEAEVA